MILDLPNVSRLDLMSLPQQQLQAFCVCGQNLYFRVRMPGHLFIESLTESCFFSCGILENIMIFRAYCRGFLGVVGIIKYVVETVDRHAFGRHCTCAHRDDAKAHLTLFQEEEKWFLYVALVS